MSLFGKQNYGNNKKEYRNSKSTKLESGTIFGFRKKKEVEKREKNVFKTNN